MVYQLNNSVDNFGWEMLVNSLTGLAGQGLDKVNEQRNLISDMWSSWNATKQAQYLAQSQQNDASNNNNITSNNNNSNNNLIYIIIGIVVLALILILIFK